MPFECPFQIHLGSRCLRLAMECLHPALATLVADQDPEAVPCVVMEASSD